jgi:ribose/xylose/arabinose/galactoside ABC-type transport system permease subunit
VVAYIGVVAYFAARLPYFLTSANFLQIVNFNVVTAILAIGFTFVLVGGGIDLSIGSNVSVGTVLIGECFIHGLPAWASFAVGVGGCTLVGAVNGFIITRCRINPLIETLAMLFVLQGVASLITGGLPSVIASNSFLVFRERPWGVGLPTYALAVIAIVSAVVLQYTRFGRHLHAVGGNPDAARQVAMNVDRFRRNLYTMSGVYCGLAAIVLASFTGQILPTAGQGREFDVATVVLLGGVSLSGGRGTVIGSLLGTLFIATLANGLVQLGVIPEVVPIIGGTLLILAVAFDQLTRGGYR